MGKTHKRLPKWVRAHKRFLIIGVVVLMVVTMAAVGGLVFTNRSPERQAKQEDKGYEDKAMAEARVARAEADGRLRDESAAAVSKGDTESAANVYSEAIKKESDVARKVQLYVDQSGVYYAAGRYEEAIEVAKRAEAMSADKFTVADWLSRIYEDRKDYVQSAKYYRMAAEWASSVQNQTGISKQEFEAEAARIDALAKAEEAK